MIFAIEKGRCVSAPMKNPPIPMGEDDHMVEVQQGQSIEYWLADVDLRIRQSRYARGCDPETGERLSDAKFSKIPEPTWRLCN